MWSLQTASVDTIWLHSLDKALASHLMTGYIPSQISTPVLVLVVYATKPLAV